MNQQEFNRRLTVAVEHAAPDDLQEVLSRCEAQKGAVISMEEKMLQKRSVSRGVMAACLAVALLLGGGGVYHWQMNGVASVVSLDVNPSIELKVSRAEKVVACVPLNEDAERILADMGNGSDLKGTKLDVAVNAIVGALLRNGYLEDISSAILISVEDRNQTRAVKLQQELTDTVDKALQASASRAAILSQTLQEEPVVEDMAKLHNISNGKAHLVYEVMEANGTWVQKGDTVPQKLAALSVEELQDMLETGCVGIPIGKAEACHIAEQYAGTLALDSVTAKADADLDDETPHYEVELHHPVWGEFTYKIDAYTGNVISGQVDLLNLMRNTEQANQERNAAVNGMIGADNAKAAAFQHAGVAEGKVSKLEVELDHEDCVYEIDFWCGNEEYEYEINALNGAVCKSKQEHHETQSGHHQQHQQHQHHQDSAADIGAQAAKAAAFKHAGVSEAQASKLEVKQDQEAGRLEYEIEFQYNGMEYEYTIDGATGAILEHETDTID